MASDKTNGTRGKKPARRWLWGVAIVLVGAAILLALRTPPTEVDLAEVDRGPMRVTLDEEGETRVRERYMISAPVSGQVLRIEIEPGDPVVAGETALVRFQPSPPSLLDARTQAETRALVEASQADVGLARAERERARAELAFAQAELKRIEKLSRSGIVSDEALDAARLAVDTWSEGMKAAEFAVATAEHTLTQAQARLSQDYGNGNVRPITIRSPVGGVVLRRLRESAAVVPAGEPLIEVADPSRLEIVADFLSEDAVRIRAATPVLIERWGGDRPLRGSVRRVEPSGFTKISALGVEEQRVNVIIDFEDPQEAWAALGDGFRVETQVVIWEADDVLRVPTSGLFRHDGGWAVFTEAAGVASLASIEIGHRNGTTAEVISGLKNGDRIVVHPSDAVRDGVSIAERER